MLVIPRNVFSGRSQQALQWGLAVGFLRARSEGQRLLSMKHVGDVVAPTEE